MKIALRATLAQCWRWRDGGLALQMAVDVSMDKLNPLDAPDYGGREWEIAGVPPTSLVLEVTKNRLNRHLRTMLEILTRLRDGPFQEMQLNRHFAHGADRDPALQAIVKRMPANERPQWLVGWETRCHELHAQPA